MLPELARLAFESDSDSIRVSAISQLLDRGYGKAASSVDIEVVVRQAVGDMNPERLDALERQLELQRVPAILDMTAESDDAEPA